MVGLEVSSDYQLLEEEALTITTRDQSTQDWIHQAKSNMFRVIFGQNYKKQEVPTVVLSLSMFDPANISLNPALKATNK